MKRTRFKFMRSVAFRWIVSYAVILLIPVIVSLVIYGQTKDIVEYEIERASGAMLKQVKFIIDGELKQIESMAAQLSIQSDIRKFLELTSDEERENAFRIYQTKQELHRFKSTNDFIKGIYIYSNKLSSVLTADTYVEDRLFYEMMHKSGTPTYEDWLVRMRESHAGRYMMMPIEDQGRTVFTPSYIQSIPFQGESNSSGTLVMPLNSQKIRTMLGHVDWVDKGQVLILDQDNQVLFQNVSDKTMSPLAYQKLNNRSAGSFTDTLDGAEVMVTVDVSETSGWKYVSVFSTDVFWERAKEIRTMNVLGLLLIFVVGGIVIYYFAQKNYNPVKELVNVFSRNHLRGEKRDFDEYTFIRQSVLETIQERDDMNNRHAQQLRVLQRYYLARLLKGQADPNLTLEEAAKAHKFRWVSDRYAVLLFFIDIDNSVMKDISLSHFIVSNIVKDLIGHRHNVDFTDVDGSLFAVVNVRPERLEEWKDDMEEVFAEALEFIERRYKFRFTLAGSELQQGLAGVHQAFLQALEAHEYRIVLGEGMLTWYGDVKPSEVSYFFTVNDQMVLLNLLKSEEYDKVKLMIDDIVMQAFEQQTSLEIAKCILLDLATTMIKAIPDQEQAGIAWDEWRPVKRLLACSTKSEFHQELLLIFERVSGTIRNRQSGQQNAGIGETIMDYVQQQYHDPNLSVSMIGNHLRLSPQYVSKLFREQTGQGLHDYISQTRIRASKVLLQGGASIDETAQSVGFTSSNAFIRVFKKYEGITPGKYKTIL